MTDGVLARSLKAADTSGLRLDFTVQDLAFGVLTNSRSVSEALGTVFGEFAGEGSNAEMFGTYRVAVDHQGTWVHTPVDGTLHFRNEDEAAEYVQWHISQTVLGRVSDRFALHAAGIVLRGHSGVTILAGPSGAGKSSLTLEFIRAGARFLSDEALFMSFTDGTVTGFPRAIGQIGPTVQSTAAAPEKDDLPGRANVRGSAHDQVLKRYDSPRSLGASVVREPLAVETLVLLNGFGPKTVVRAVRPGAAIPSLMGQVYAREPVEPIVSALVRLVSTARVVELTLGPNQEVVEEVTNLPAAIEAA